MDHPCFVATHEKKSELPGLQSERKWAREAGKTGNGGARKYRSGESNN